QARAEGRGVWLGQTRWPGRPEGRAGRVVLPVMILSAVLVVVILSAVVGVGAPGPAASPRPGAMRAACAAARRGYLRCFALFARHAGVNAAIAAGARGPGGAPGGGG